MATKRNRAAKRRRSVDGGSKGVPVVPEATSAAPREDAGAASIPAKNRLSPRQAIGLALTLTPLLVQALAVRFLAVQAPLGEEVLSTVFIRAFREGGPWARLIWAWHNEHRIATTNLTIVLLDPLVGLDAKAQMCVSVVLTALTLLGLWRLYQSAGGAELLFFAPAAWVLCSLSLHETMLTGMLMCFYYTAAGVVWSLVFLSRRGALSLGLACGCAVVATCSLLNGVLVWPVGLLLLIFRRASWKSIFAWCVTAAVTLRIFFVGWPLPSAVGQQGLADVPRIVLGALSSLGAPLAAGSVAWSRAIGALLALATTVMAIQVLRSSGADRIRQAAPLVGLMCFAVLTALTIGAGRVDLNPLQSRYAVFPTLGLAAAYLLAARDVVSVAPWASANRGFVAAVAVLLPGLVAANLAGFHEAEGVRATRLVMQSRLQTFEHQADADLGHPWVKLWIGSYMRARRFSPFSEPLHLLLPRSDETPTPGPVLTGGSAELELACPVDVLYDVAVPLSVEGVPDGSTVELSLWHETRRLALLELPLTSLAKGYAGWVKLEPTEPLRECKGGRLRVRIDSTAPESTQLTLWTYAPYHDGRLRQGQRQLAPGRSLGLLVNHFHFSLS